MYFDNEAEHLDGDEESQARLREKASRNGKRDKQRHGRDSSKSNDGLETSASEQLRELRKRNA